MTALPTEITDLLTGFKDKSLDEQRTVFAQFTTAVAGVLFEELGELTKDQSRTTGIALVTTTEDQTDASSRMISISSNINTLDLIPTLRHLADQFENDILSRMRPDLRAKMEGNAAPPAPPVAG